MNKEYTHWAAHKATSFFLIAALFCGQCSLAFAQTLDTTVTPETEQAPAPVDTASPAEPVVEPVVTPEADTVAPVFISIVSESAQETQATVVWTTDESAYGYVEYGETESYGLSTQKSADAALDHSVSVSNLTPGTAYHYRIVAEDKSGNIRHSQDRTFETALEIVAIDNVPPEISQVSVTNITPLTATIGWVTNELAQGKVEYGKTMEYGLSSSLTIDYATEHSLSLDALQEGTQYHYRIVAQDESGNETASPDEIFTTGVSEATPPPTQEPVVSQPATSTPPTNTSPSDSGATATETPPPAPTPTPTLTAFAISEVETVLISASSTTIIWKTNEPANAQVFYGPGETYASFSSKSATRITSHEITLSGLNPGTNYFYKVVSQNASGETIDKSGFEFTTLYKQKTIAVAPIISHVRFESVGESSAVILFNTDIPAAGIVNYGATTAYEETDGGHTTLLTEHRHPLSDLSSDALYDFQIVVQDTLGNETAYQNAFFKTLAATSNSQNIPVAPINSQPTAPPQAPASSPPPINIPPMPPLIVPVKNSSGSGGGGIYFIPPPVKVIGKPAITKVEGLNEQALFLWQAAPSTTGLKTLIVRNENGYAASPSQGSLVYEGNSGRFSDTNLENGKNYYYSVFRANQAGTYSTPLHFLVLPKQEKTQTALIATPPVVQKTPIYVFPTKLSLGDSNKHVEHLQVLLASQPSIYPRGLITSYFGPLTESAIKAFQKRYKLNVTGVADMPTLKKLENLSGIETANDKSASYDAALTRDLAIGSSGKDVSILQQFLINAEVYPEALVTGYFGPLTRTALQRFQREQHIIPPQGYFGPITKRRVLNLIRLRSVSF